MRQRTQSLLVIGTLFATLALPGCSGGGADAPPLPSAAITQPATPLPPPPGTPTPLPTPDASVPGLYLLDVATGDLTQLNNGHVRDAAFTPDGKAIWYWSGPLFPTGGTDDDPPSLVRSLEVKSGEDRLVFDLHGGGFAHLDPVNERPVFVRHAGFIPEASEPQGGRIDYTVFAVDRSGERALGSGLGAAISPDGSRVAFHSPACSNSSTVRVLEFDSGRTNDFGERVAYGSLRWVSPTVLTGTQYAPPAWFTVDVTAGSVIPGHPIPSLPTDASATFSPDRDSALIAQAVLVPRVILRNMVTGEERELARERLDVSAWSHDSSAVAYVTDATLAVATAEGDNLVELNLERDFGLYARPRALDWSPDGSQLVVAVAASLGRGTCT